MNVLSKLTKEYLGDTLRDEKGKFLNIMGCKVIVPGTYNEEMFIETVENFTKVLSTYTDQHLSFTEKDYLNDFGEDVTQIKCKNDVYMEIDITFERFLKLWNKSNKGKVMDETLYKSIITFLRYIAKDVEIVFNEGRSNILLVDEDEFYDKFLEQLNDIGYLDYKEQYLSELKNMFFKKFEKKANLTKSSFSFVYGEKYNEYAIMPLFSYTDFFQFKTFLYAKEMRQWWEDTLNKIKKKGVVAYFGLNKNKS